MVNVARYKTNLAYIKTTKIYYLTRRVFMNKRLIAYLMTTAIALSAFMPSVALAQEPIAPVSQVSTMASAELFTIKGTFNDFFPDSGLASIVAKQLGKEVEDQVTLAELQKVERIDDCMVSDLAGIGYLMGLKHMGLRTCWGWRFENLDEIENCYNIESIEINGFNDDFSFIDQFITLPLKRVKFNAQYTSRHRIPQIWVEKYNNGELEMEVDHYLETGFLQIEENNLNAFEEGIKDLFVEGNGTLLLRPDDKITLSATCNGKTEFSFEKEASQNLDDFIKDCVNNFNEVGYYHVLLEQNSSNDNSSVVRKAFYDVIKTKIKKEVNTTVKSLDGLNDIAISGMISGDFADGMTTLTNRWEIENQNLKISMNGTEYGPSAITMLSVTVSNGQILSATIVGNVNGSIFVAIV